MDRLRPESHFPQARQPERQRQPRPERLRQPQELAFSTGVCRELLPVGTVVLANSRDLGAWYKGHVLQANRVFGLACYLHYTHTVQYEAHHIDNGDDTESGIPWSHIAVAEGHRREAIGVFGAP